MCAKRREKRIKLSIASCRLRQMEQLATFWGGTHCNGNGMGEEQREREIVTRQLMRNYKEL